MTSSPAPFITIVMPALNEARYIERAILSVLPEDASVACELLVLDGGSSDGTRDIVNAVAQRDPRVRLVHNPRRIQSAAMNIAAKSCDPRTEILVRADCHAVYPHDFAVRLARKLREKDCASVVVAMRAVGHSVMQRAIAAAQNCRLGNGGSRHRGSGVSGYVEHGHHAAFDRRAFLDLGGYDESAPYNEDAEFDARLIAAGHRIYLDGASTIAYFPRARLADLARQYARHGYGRANTSLKHGQWPRLRQTLPLVVLALLVSGIALDPVLGSLALAPSALYIALCIVWGALLALAARDPALVFSGVAAIAMHVSWAIGFLKRVLEGRDRAVAVIGAEHGVAGQLRRP